MKKSNTFSWTFLKGLFHETSINKKIINSVRMMMMHVFSPSQNGCSLFTSSNCRCQRSVEFTTSHHSSVHFIVVWKVMFRRNKITVKARVRLLLEKSVTEESLGDWIYNTKRQMIRIAMCQNVAQMAINELNYAWHCNQFESARWEIDSGVRPVIIEM